MSRKAAIAPAAVALLLSAAGGCAYHRSPVNRWYFYDSRTGKPVGQVLLLEWTEKFTARTPQEATFQERVPSAGALAEVRAVRLTRAEPGFRPGRESMIHAYPGTLVQRQRYMAVHPDYSGRIVYANPERLAQIDAAAAADPSAAYILLDSQTSAGEAVDWLAWLAHGRELIRRDLSAADRQAVYGAFGLYWERTAVAHGESLAAELSTRGRELADELNRIYRFELNRAAPPLTSG